MSPEVSAGRFQRQIALPGFGEEGQHRIGQSSVLVVGIGAVGSVAAMLLARAGIGRIGIVDFDTVEPSNLHRQPFFDEDDVGHPKVDVLLCRLKKANSNILVEPHRRKSSRSFLLETVHRYDVVVDAVDSFASKLAINDVVWRAGVPMVFGGVSEYMGQVLTIVPKKGPCLRCIVHQTRRQQHVPSPVFPPIATIVGSVLASEVLKLLLCIGTPLVGRLLLLSASDWAITILPIGRRVGCVTCDS